MVCMALFCGCFCVCFIDGFVRCFVFGMTIGLGLDWGLIGATGVVKKLVRNRCTTYQEPARGQKAKKCKAPHTEQLFF